MTKGFESFMQTATATTTTGDEELAKKSHSDLFILRTMTQNDTEVQNKLAPLEHRAFAREWVKEDGPLAAASLSVAIPAYATSKILGIEPLAKKFGLLEDDGQEATTNYAGEIKHGFIGIGEGLQAYFSDPAQETTQKQPDGVIAAVVDKYNTANNTVDELLPFLIGAESKGQHTDSEGNLTTSPVGALGITQVMPKTAENPGYGVEPLQNDTQEEYIRFSRDYLTAMLRVFDDKEQALAAYNAGPGAVHRAISKSSRTGRDWVEFIPRETQKYIEKIKGKQEASKPNNNSRYSTIRG